MSKLSDEKILELAHRRATKYTHWTTPGEAAYGFTAQHLIDFVRHDIEAAVLAEQEKQEPVAYRNKRYTNELLSVYQFQQLYKQDQHHFEPLYAAPVVPSDMIRPDQEALQQIIAAALYDFGGFITTRQKQLVASATDNAADTVEALKEFMEKRGINPCQDVPVLSWQCWIATAEGKSNANVCGLPHGKESK